MAIFHLTHKFLKRSSGASSVSKAAYNAGQKIEDNKGSTEFSDYTRKQQLSQKVSGLRKSWATLANRHLKRYGHKATIDERSLKAQGSKRNPTRHRGPRPKSTRYMLDKLRAKQPPQPIAPLVRITKQTHADGSISIQAVIKRSALNNIQTGSNNRAIAPALNVGRKGWPEAAVRDWEAWGSKEPARFFTVWPELKPEGFVAADRPRP